MHIDQNNYIFSPAFAEIINNHNLWQMDKRLASNSQIRNHTSFARCIVTCQYF